MALIGTVPRRAVNLPPGSLRTLLGARLTGKVVEGPALEAYAREFAGYIGTSHAIFAASGRSAFQLALESLGLKPGQEIIFPAFTFPVMPMVAKLLGYEPVFCDADPETYNSGPEHFEPLITEKTGAILATHLFGLPCRIAKLRELATERGIYLMEDCAHACGASVDGRKVGTFGDLAIFSFAEGKNMPCFGGGALVTSDDAIAGRAREILKTARVPSAGAAFKKGLSIWIMWLITRPLIFGLSVFPMLRLKLALGKPLMDSAVGNELVAKFAGSDPKITRFVNLQAAIGVKQLKHIDAFNDGARHNAKVLTDHLGEVPGVRPARSIAAEHIYVYYPIAVTAERRDDLRHHLLRHGIDTKTTDMADCAVLEPFREATEKREGRVSPTEAALLEICVYPVIKERQMRKIAKVIRAWAGLPEIVR